MAIIYLKMLLWVMVGFSNWEVSLQKRHNLLYVFVYNRIHRRNHILSAIGFVDFFLTSPLSAFKNPKSRANIFECLVLFPKQIWLFAMTSLFDLDLIYLSLLLAPGSSAKSVFVHLFCLTLHWFRLTCFFSLPPFTEGNKKHFERAWIQPGSL